MAGLMEKRDDETMAEFEARIAKETREYKKKLDKDPRSRAFQQGVPGKDIDFKTYDMPPKYNSLDEDAMKPIERAEKRRFLAEERERITGKKPMLAKGGAVKKSIDGCAQRGKTKGRMV